MKRNSENGAKEGQFVRCRSVACFKSKRVVGAELGRAKIELCTIMTP
jgi:hypothetical protein